MFWYIVKFHVRHKYGLKNVYISNKLYKINQNEKKNIMCDNMKFA